MCNLAVLARISITCSAHRRHPLDQQNTRLLKVLPGLQSVAKNLLGEFCSLYCLHIIGQLNKHSLGCVRPTYSLLHQSAALTIGCCMRVCYMLVTSKLFT